MTWAGPGQQSRILSRLHEPREKLGIYCRLLGGNLLVYWHTWCLMTCMTKLYSDCKLPVKGVTMWIIIFEHFSWTPNDCSSRCWCCLTFQESLMILSIRWSAGSGLSVGVLCPDPFLSDFNLNSFLECLDWIMRSYDRTHVLCKHMWVGQASISPWAPTLVSHQYIHLSWNRSLRCLTKVSWKLRYSQRLHKNNTI